MVLLEVLLGNLGTVYWGIVVLEPHICSTFNRKKLSNAGISPVLRIGKNSAAFSDLSHLMSSVTPALEDSPETTTLPPQCFIIIVMRSR